MKFFYIVLKIIFTFCVIITCNINMFCYASFSESYIPVSASPSLCALASGELIFCPSSPFGGISSRLFSCDPCPSYHTCYLKQSGKQKIFLLHSKTFHSFCYTQIIYNCMHTICECSAAAILTHVIIIYYLVYSPITSIHASSFRAMATSIILTPPITLPPEPSLSLIPACSELTSLWLFPYLATSIALTRYYRNIWLLGHPNTCFLLNMHTYWKKRA